MVKVAACWAWEVRRGSLGGQFVHVLGNNLRFIRMLLLLKRRVHTQERTISTSSALSA